jgi:GT2 family glycosyltransferase
MSLVSKPFISIIISNYNSGKLLLNYVTNIIDTACTNEYEIVIVDNNSMDKSINYVYDFIKKNNIKNVKIIKLDRNAGYVNAVNIGLGYARGHYLVISNEDVLIKTRCWDRLLLRCLQNENVGICAPLKHSFYPQHLDGCGACLSQFFIGYDLCYMQRLDTYQPVGVSLVPYPPGAFFAIKRDLIDRYILNPLLYMYYDDVEIGLRTYAKGKIVVYTDFIVVAHKRGTVGIKPLAYYLSRRNHILVALLYGNKLALLFALMYSLASSAFVSFIRRNKYMTLYAVYAMKNALRVFKSYGKKFKKYNYVYSKKCSLIKYLRHYV